MKSFKKGFTIIELLIVMSIIFVLMGLLVPRFKGYRMKAENLKIENYARQIYTATMASYSEMDGKFVKENIEDNIINLINITGNKKESGEDHINVTADEKSATITFTIKNNNYEVNIDEDGYSLKNSNGSI
ncbi:type IV pilus assembly protein PilA [Clostridium tetanomorphum]|uniref:Type II secretion system protein n=1 Tax=Clostridium tetanomorphum TaxID=1553 RepID=A0A923E7L0_CLOTT|nr:type II secretion system protein [Clostridium tetanomorphum]KAJ53423.1 hypothetical protein CTM_02994 [Clostridium tetanomorphum DSM 665]MBC2396591.1 type II secretion system protein [Clostridium tetanomorphum]MBP1863919.1 type IV pilus assembly protein PilA [Clostridium tetanomorphum]NRS84997.1 type IV pilus assembly protein PilA [Clostridium tetanomorphum]NRZ98213.1 type IV pilus assembly protein PilA [Clostridium tetanomorphum]